MKKEKFKPVQITSLPIVKGLSVERPQSYLSYKIVNGYTNRKTGLIHMDCSILCSPFTQDPYAGLSGNFFSDIQNYTDEKSKLSLARKKYELFIHENFLSKNQNDQIKNSPRRTANKTYPKGKTEEDVVLDNYKALDFYYKALAGYHDKKSNSGNAKPKKYCKEHLSLYGKSTAKQKIQNIFKPVITHSFILDKDYQIQNYNPVASAGIIENYMDYYDANEEITSERPDERLSIWYKFVQTQMGNSTEIKDVVNFNKLVEDTTTILQKNLLNFSVESGFEALIRVHKQDLPNDAPIKSTVCYLNTSTLIENRIDPEVGRLPIMPHTDTAKLNGALLHHFLTNKGKNAFSTQEMACFAEIASRTVKERPHTKLIHAA